MAIPMTADQMVKALSAEGVNVREYRSWRTHDRNHRGQWGPVHGVVIHHTAGVDSLALCYNGMSGLPGPLCHAHLSKTGQVSLLSAGRSNHAGSVAANAYNAMVNESSVHPRPDSAEPIDGNARTYGIEIENRGDGRDPYPDTQYDQAVRWAAAICRFHGWTADSVVGHAELTRRKIDPSFPMAAFRAAVAARLSAPVTPEKPPVASPDKPCPPAPAPVRPVRPRVSLSAVVSAARKDPSAPQGHVTAKTAVMTVERALVRAGLLADRWADGSFGTMTVSAYGRWQYSLGYRGKAADGIPGKASLTALGKRFGFDVVA